MINWGLIRTILILPATALVYIPGMILALSRDTRYAPKRAKPTEGVFWLGLSLLAVGVTFSAWTVRLILKHGEGGPESPAPWSPPQKLVVRGPYRHVRNPMIASVIVNTLAEACLFKSWPLVWWTGVHVILQTIYFKKREEPELVERFGVAYVRYMENVPRWIPRLEPWMPPAKE